MISEWTSTKEKEEEKLEADGGGDDSKENAGQVVPGPRADLNIVHNVNVVDLMKRSRVEYVKEVQTDSVEIAQHSEIIGEDTSNRQLNEILATFIENKVSPWPPEQDEIDEDAGDSKADEAGDAPSGVQRVVSIGYAVEEEKRDDSPEMMELATFMDAMTADGHSSFMNKSEMLLSAIGINEQHSVFIEAQSAIRDNMETSQMDLLVKSAELHEQMTAGRAVTCLDYDTEHGNRFLAAFSGVVHSGSMKDAAINIHSDGLINVYDVGGDAGDSAGAYRLVRTLECQSMISCAEFHPTKENMVIGASVSGQVLGWDMRSNKRTPSIRTEFSSSCHTQPIFALRFLPSMSHLLSSKIEQIATLSNDAKMCVWRDDMLYKPNNEFELKLSRAKEDGHGGVMANTQAKEITTTCFSFPRNFAENRMWMGSDEGSIYQMQLNLNKNDDKELPITWYIPSAHHGPITCIDFNQNQRVKDLYLTSSFDWTVKLWHTGSSRPISLFTNMQDYVYDVKWSPTNPSIFAAGDGSGCLTIFDLNSSFEHPTSEPTSVVSPEQVRNNELVSITKIMWAPNGKQIIVGDSNGKITIFDYPVSDSTDNDLDKFDEILTRRKGQME